MATTTPGDRSAVFKVLLAVVMAFASLGAVAQTAPPPVEQRQFVPDLGTVIRCVAPEGYPRLRDLGPLSIAVLLTAGAVALIRNVVKRAKSRSASILGTCAAGFLVVLFVASVGLMVVTERRGAAELATCQASRR